ncbi:MAG: PepSY-associated TM helix domain-containing protein [Pyrinomonadaceae bacterium]
MKTLRKILFWTHLTAGLLGGIVIFIMCVTGAALSFEKNLTEFAERNQRYVAVPADAKRLGPQEILNKVREVKPKAKPAGISIANRPDAAYVVSLGREGQIFVDPYTGAITGEGSHAVGTFFDVATDLHRYIALSGDGRAVGKAITGACNLLFLLLAITGIYIWFPRQLTWRLVKPVMWFRRGVKGKARDFNWHNTIGFWCSLILIVLTVTAAVISYQWASNLVYRLTGNEPPQQQGPGGPGGGDRAYAWVENLNPAWTKAEAQSPGWKSISLRLPLAKDAAVFTIDEGRSWNIFGRSTLTVEARSGQVTKWEPYGAQNSGRQLRSWFRFTHTGESFGLVGQFIGFVACVGGAFLAFTGISLAIRRFSRWRGRNGKWKMENG